MIAWRSAGEIIGRMIGTTVRGFLFGCGFALALQFFGMLP